MQEKTLPGVNASPVVRYSARNLRSSVFPAKSTKGEQGCEGNGVYWLALPDISPGKMCSRVVFVTPSSICGETGDHEVELDGNVLRWKLAEGISRESGAYRLNLVAGSTKRDVGPAIAKLSKSTLSSPRGAYLTADEMRYSMPEQCHSALSIVASDG